MANGILMRSWRKKFLYISIFSLLLISLGLAVFFRISGTTHSEALPIVLSGKDSAEDSIPHPFSNEDGWVYSFDNVPDGALPEGMWNYEDGTEVANYNNELQAYTARKENVRIENGYLTIEARKEHMYGKNYTSARINTLGKFDFTYGTLEAEVMLPKGIGTWPAIWLMPSKNIYNPDDFAIAKDDKFRWAVNGEIDFVEAIGRIPNQNIPAAHNYNQLHTASVYTPKYIADPYGSFHTYGVIKKPDSITFTLDGVAYATRQKSSDNPLEWPHDQPYYLIINLAIGGDWAGADGIDDSSGPWQMKIKSLRYKPL